MLTESIEVNQALEKSGAFKHNAERVTDITAECDGILYSDRNGDIKKAEELTETDFRDLLERVQNGMFEDSSYIPMRASTPEFFINVVREHSIGKYNVMPVPMAAQVKHLRQNMEEDEEDISYGDARPHNLSVDDIVTISKEMGHPAYIVLQNNGRYAMVVSFYNKVSKKVVVSIDFASDKDTIKNYKYKQYMNGYNDGYYNIIVTQFEPDDLSSYLKNNEVVYDKKKMNGRYQVGFGRIVTFTHDTPFIENIVSHPEQNVKRKFSTKDENIRYSKRDYSYETLVAKPDMKLTVVENNVPSNRADVVRVAKQNAAKVGKFNQKDRYVSVFVDDIQTDVVLATKESAMLNASRYAENPLSVTDSTISIAELLDYVNKYFPDILPESVLKHYGYDARPDVRTDDKLGESALFAEKDNEIYTEKDYWNYGWARANDILNEGQNADYRSKFAMAKSGLENFPKSKNGELIIPVNDIYDSVFRGINNILVFADGTVDNPTITSIIEIYEYDETHLDIVRRNIYELERRGIQQKTEGVVRRHYATDIGIMQYGDYIESIKDNNGERIRGNDSEETSSAERNGEEINLYAEKDTTSIYDIMGETKRIKKENELLKADVKRLKERLKLEGKVTDGKIFNETHLLKAAGHLRNIAKSNIDKVELAQYLKEFYTFIAQQGENIDWENLYARSYRIAESILEETKPIIMTNDYALTVLRNMGNKSFWLTIKKIFL